MPDPLIPFSFPHESISLLRPWCFSSVGTLLSLCVLASCGQRYFSISFLMKLLGLTARLRWMDFFQKTEECCDPAFCIFLPASTCGDLQVNAPSPCLPILVFLIVSVLSINMSVHPVDAGTSTAQSLGRVQVFYALCLIITAIVVVLADAGSHTTLFSALRAVLVTFYSWLRQNT